MSDGQKGAIDPLLPLRTPMVSNVSVVSSKDSEFKGFGVQRIPSSKDSEFKGFRVWAHTSGP